MNSVAPTPPVTDGDELAATEARKSSRKRSSIARDHEAVQQRLKEYKKAQGLVFHPEKDRFCKRWDAVVGLALVFTALVTPAEVAFGEVKIDMLFGINRLLDLVFITDIYINFYVGYFDAYERMWVLDKEKIRKRYIRGWFGLDVVSSVPYDCFGLIIEAIESSNSGDGAEESVAQLKMLRLLKILRLLKLLRILKASRILKQIQAQLKLSNATASLVKFFCGAGLVVHWVACLWGMGASLGAGKDGDGNELETWVTALEAQNETPMQLYSRCLEFSIMAMVMGYGASEPVNTAERYLACISMILAGSFYGYMIGSICSILSKSDPATRMFRDQSDMVIRFLQESEFPAELGIKLQEYFGNCEQLFRNKMYSSVCAAMSPALQREIAYSLHARSVAKIPYLNADDEGERANFVAALSLQLKPVAFPPDEEIFATGDDADYMMIVSRGMASVSGSRPQDIRLVRERGHFGENMVLTNARRTRNAKSLTYLNCNKLTRRQLENLLFVGPDGGKDSSASKFPQTLLKLKKFKAQLHLKQVMATIRKVFSIAAVRNQLSGAGWSKQQYADYKAHLLQIGKEKSEESLGKGPRTFSWDEIDSLSAELALTGVDVGKKAGADASEQPEQRESRELSAMANQRTMAYATKVVDDYLLQHHPEASAPASAIVSKAKEAFFKPKHGPSVHVKWDDTQLSTAARETPSAQQKNRTAAVDNAATVEQGGSVSEQLAMLTQMMVQMQGEISQMRRDINSQMVQ